MRGHTEIHFSAQARDWLNGLGPRDAANVVATVDLLRRRGPDLERPWVKRIKMSRHHQMMELRPPDSHLRVLFAFDPRGRAQVLVGGDKTNDWRGWYDRNVPVADRLFDQHLRTMGGGERWRTRPNGKRFEPRSR